MHAIQPILLLLLILAMGLWGIYVSRRALKTGSIRYKLQTFKRHDEPFWFWFYVITSGGIGLGLVGTAIYYAILVAKTK